MDRPTRKLAINALEQQRATALNGAMDGQRTWKEQAVYDQQVSEISLAIAELTREAE